MNYKAWQRLTRSPDNICADREIRIPQVSPNLASSGVDCGATNVPRQCPHPNQFPSSFIEVINWELCQDGAVYPNPLLLDSRLGVYPGCSINGCMTIYPANFKPAYQNTSISDVSNRRTYQYFSDLFRGKEAFPLYFVQVSETPL